MSSKIVGSSIALSKPSCNFDHAYSFSNSDKGLLGGRILKKGTVPLMEKLVATGVTEIGMARFIGQVFDSSLK